MNGKHQQHLQHVGKPPEPKPMPNVTVIIYCLEVNQMFTKRHKLTAKRSKTTTRIQKTTAKRHK